ncbi:MAG: Na(+)/H(+) antiporter subunit B [Alphaproteobacteria bacterium]|mgnify:CR=1 FL=1|nr:Na(+)/H(+) antiporter subunit B [Alphaproteobacteria bacterium]|tara:strand:- start:2270 stop:2680 length:411 start_codon:yes stop_codon:yes gene_type:complete
MMNSLILKTVGRILLIWMLLFSWWVLLRGQSAPGGGFIGGLIASCALALYLLSYGISRLQQLIVLSFKSWMCVGGLMLIVTGLLQFSPRVVLSLARNQHDVALSVIHLLFDAGIYIVVCFSVLSILVELERAKINS